MTRVLVVEDNAALAAGLRSNLEYEGYDTVGAADFSTGLSLAASARPDVVILDLLLPGGDGFALLRQLRERDDRTPVLVLTALGEEADKLRGFRAGADDYVTKPFGLLELLARVDALLRRSGAGDRGPAVRLGRDVLITVADRTVTRDGRPVALRPKEFDLLLALVRRRGAVATRLELLREVWGYDESVMSRTVDTHVAELRRKLEEEPAAPRHVLTVRKVGYRLDTGA